MANKAMKNIKIGIEVECVINADKVSVNAGAYHSGVRQPGLPLWKVERDGSLRSNGEFENARTCEFVSNVIRSKNGYNKALKKLQEFLSAGDSYDMCEVVAFNNSCGSHVHFSIKDFNFKENVVFKKYRGIRKHFLKRIDKSKVLSQETKEAIKKQYVRNYAKRLTRARMERSVRHTEFNFSSEDIGTGLEWRSINLNNVQDWEEFHEVFKIIYECLEFLYKLSTKYTSTYNQRIPDVHGDRNNGYALKFKVAYDKKKDESIVLTLTATDKLRNILKRAIIEETTRFTILGNKKYTRYKVKRSRVDGATGVYFWEMLFAKRLVDNGTFEVVLPNTAYINRMMDNLKTASKRLIYAEYIDSLGD